MQTHSKWVPNLFASAKEAAATRNRKQKILDAEQATINSSSWTVQMMESEVQDALAGESKNTLAQKTWCPSRIVFLSCTSTRCHPRKKCLSIWLKYLTTFISLWAHSKGPSLHWRNIHPLISHLSTWGPQEKCALLREGVEQHH